MKQLSSIGEGDEANYPENPFVEDSIQETPTNPVKCFAHVQFKGPQEFMTLFSPANMVGEFTSEEGTVGD